MIKLARWFTRRFPRLARVAGLYPIRVIDEAVFGANGAVYVKKEHHELHWQPRMRSTPKTLGNLCCYAETIAPGTVVDGHECCGGEHA